MQARTAPPPTTSKPAELAGRSRRESQRGVGVRGAGVRAQVGLARLREGVRSAWPHPPLATRRTSVSLLTNNTLTHTHSQPQHHAQALPAVATVQDAIVGGAVFAAIGAAAWAGARGDPTPCTLCSGTGGCGCFACSASGASSATKATGEGVIPARPLRRDPLGRAAPPAGQCRVCGGTGMVLCSACRGSGFKF
jgi:hypothetical protein